METAAYDVVIIGAGQAGVPLSTALARAGRRTALIERAHIGGTCINEGCTPTKTMVASARVAYLARRAADYGVHAGPIAVDLVKIRERKRLIVNQFRAGSQGNIEQTAGLDLIMGEARFRDATTIDVALNTGGERRLSASIVLIDTGTRSARPTLPGLADVPLLDSTSIMELDVIPEHLIVLGGGYVGLEFAQMFRRFGSTVTIVQRGGQLLPREDADIAEAVTHVLREDGIEVLLSAAAQEVSSQRNRILLKVDHDGAVRTIEGSHLLVATGRAPNTDRLSAAAAGVKLDKRGFIPVNERLETNVPGIYALGDVNGGPAFTHISYDDYRIIQTNLLHNGSATTTGRLVPYTVFIDPQLGRVGLSEREAAESGRKVRVAKMPMSYVARALETDEPRGLMKAIVDAETQQILGCAVFSIEGGEIMAVLQMAMLGKLPYTTLRDAVFAHPTLAESLNSLFMALEN